jgi:septum formation protein
VEVSHADRPAVRVILASASPRRLDLLRRIGVEPVIRPAGVDETALPAEPPRATALRLARAKAQAVAAAAPPPAGWIVIGADTVVEIDRLLLAKPEDAAAAEDMLARLSGRTHEVHTGLALAGPGGLLRSDVATTEVEFAPLSAADIAAYVATGEPFDKAGAYAVQGLGARLVSAVRGSRSNVIGLPLELLFSLCPELGPASGLDLELS